MSGKIPDFRGDGYLPVGIHKAPEAEITFRFGTSTRRRRTLVLRVRQWIDLARQVGAKRLLVDGSFVTAKPEPNDVDSVVLLPNDFSAQVISGRAPAIELENMMQSRRPEEIFGADDDNEWNEWVEFFSRTREIDRRRKGLIEVEL